MKGKARGKRKGIGKGEKGDNSYGKDGRTVTCYTCGKQGHTSTFCYSEKGKSGKGQNKGHQQSSSQQPGKGYPQSPPCQQQDYSQPSTPQHPPSTSQPPPKGYNKSLGKHWNKGGKKGQQVPVHQTNDNDYYHEEDPYAWDNSWSQEWYPDGDANPQWSGQEVGQVLQQQPSGDTTTSPQTMGCLYEIRIIRSLKAVGYNGYNGSNDIHLDRQSSRHLKDFWSIIIDTGDAVSVCPMTFCEHIEVKIIPESARRQFLTVTGEGLTISGWKEVTLVIGHMRMHCRFAS
eukprot:3212954-Amphidinium_carterae.3